MGVITYDTQVTSSIPPARLFKAFVLDGDHLMPKLMPSIIKSVEILQGDGGPGTIKLTSFGEGSQLKCLKQRVDVIDKENLTYCYSVIEGEALKGVFESISYEIKFLSSPDGGTICKNTSKYHTKGDVHISEEEIKKGKDKASSMFKVVEAHLLANPDAYN
ncbi:unnamed protein product [Thlaspi arvense]|uniref:Bet v I/Major latex protein domain-containing protein n=1 Tax=Thlaspi arvense TaxID=13288 RepID=A0AAU9S3D4_THLAR|nr:unnamed protein product [Thlaspi arvense]